MPCIRPQRAPIVVLIGWAALVLAGCSTQVLEADSPAPEVQDCHEPVDLFENFRVQIKHAARVPAGQAKASTLNIDLEFSDQTPLPHALSNSGDGYLFAVEAALLSGKGASIKPKATTGALSATGIHDAIKPGLPAAATLAFDVTDDTYTLVLTRKPTGSAAPGDPRDRVIACKISG